MSETNTKVIKMKTEPNGPNSDNPVELKNEITVEGIDENNQKALIVEAQIAKLQDDLAKRKYRVKTTSDCVSYLMNEFYPNVEWTGYECYAISETYKDLKKSTDKAKVSKTGKVGFTMRPELLEAIFHFIKKQPGKGLTLAIKHRELAEDFSLAMAAMNTDRQELRDLAMEAEAAKHGISVDDYQRLAEENAPQNGAAMKMPR